MKQSQGKEKEKVSSLPTTNVLWEISLQEFTLSYHEKSVSIEKRKKNEQQMLLNTALTVWFD